MANAENPYLERQKLMNDRCFEVGLDEVLKSIYGEAFNTFHERYPYCKVIDYSKPHNDLKKKPYTKAKKKGKRKRR